MSGFQVSNLSYKELQPLLNEDSIVILPIGSGLSQHGRHLPLGTSMKIAGALAEEVRKRTDVLVLPILSYSHNPQLADRSGTISVSSRTFIDFVKDIFSSYARHGVKKFVALNIGEEAVNPLYTVATEMNNEYTAKVAVALGGIGGETIRKLTDEPMPEVGGAVETSLVLWLDPESVRREKIVDETASPFPDAYLIGDFLGAFIAEAVDTEGGVNGHPSKADAETGRQIFDAMVDDTVYFIDHFREFEITTY